MPFETVLILTFEGQFLSEQVLMRLLIIARIEEQNIQISWLTAFCSVSTGEALDTVALLASQNQTHQTENTKHPNEARLIRVDAHLIKHAARTAVASVNNTPYFFVDKRPTIRDTDPRALRDLENREKQYLSMLRLLLTALLLFCKCSIGNAREIHYPQDDLKSHIVNQLPYTLILEHHGLDEDASTDSDIRKNLPREFNWGNVSGVSYLTHSLNQHIPVRIQQHPFSCSYVDKSLWLSVLAISNTVDLVGPIRACRR